MKVLIQRVRRAEVRIDGTVEAGIGAGMVVLLGIEMGDDAAEIDFQASKTANLRIFPDEAGVMNRSVLEVGGEALVVSQFTLAASTRKGRRPSYARAAAPDLAEPLYRRYVAALAAAGVPVHTGRFQAMMEVELVNDGPVTILLDPPGPRREGVR